MTFGATIELGCSMLASRRRGGADRVRTGGLRLARAALSQLSYSPEGASQEVMVGLSGFEPLTSRLSGVRSDQLSYRPVGATEADTAPQGLAGLPQGGALKTR